MINMVVGGSLAVVLDFLVGWTVWMLLEGRWMSPLAAWRDILTWRPVTRR